MAADGVAADVAADGVAGHVYLDAFEQADGVEAEDSTSEGNREDDEPFRASGGVMPSEAKRSEAMNTLTLACLTFPGSPVEGYVSITVGTVLYVHHIYLYIYTPVPPYVATVLNHPLSERLAVEVPLWHVRLSFLV